MLAEHAWSPLLDPNTIRPGMVADADLLGIQEVEAGASRAQIHPQLHEDFKINPGYWRPCLKTQRYHSPQKILEETSLSLSFLAPNHPSSLPAVLCPSAGKASSLLHVLEQPP